MKSCRSQASHATIGLLLLLASPAAADGPSHLERGPVSRWLWNPVERTARGVEAFAAGDPAAAVDPLETALRLRPESPVALYNAGTARFAAGAADAMALLEAAAGAAGAAVAPRANYNLGTARLAAGDLEGAIEALEEALRREPGMEDAKFNLELALRRQRQAEQGGGGESQDGREPPQGREEETRSQDPEPEGQEPPQDEEDSRPPQPERESPLPRFRDLPDMSAEEAAAILQAIENMEREQRREAAERSAAASSGRTKDW